MNDLREALRVLEERLAYIGGCSDGNCIVHSVPGQHTNGGCRCLSDKYKALKVVTAYKEAVKALTE